MISVLMFRLKQIRGRSGIKFVLVTKVRSVELRAALSRGKCPRGDTRANHQKLIRERWVRDKCRHHNERTEWLFIPTRAALYSYITIRSPRHVQHLISFRQTIQMFLISINKYKNIDIECTAIARINRFVTEIQVKGQLIKMNLM